jgi:hypothetical protein
MDANKMIEMGKVAGTPVISDNGGKKQAFFHLLANHRAPGANGQWVDNFCKLPVYALDKKADVIEKNVVDGQELYLEGRYQSWDMGNGTLGHGMIIDAGGTISLGFKPRTDAQKAGGGGGGGAGAFGPPM